MQGKPVTRRAFLGRSLGAAGAAALAQAWHSGAAAQGDTRKPNFIVIFTDDQGYNDLGCFGSPHIKTPNIDRMAAEGMKFTDFYASAPVCTPSRASLMTGCYAQRVGLAAMPNKNGTLEPPAHVLFPYSTCGINADEITVAEGLKGLGYATACVGKWHLGHLPPFLPTRHGFDHYYGIPYSNDMAPSPLMRDETVLEEPAVQAALTERYTEEAIQFISANKDRPFFLYLPHNMPHTPLHVSPQFSGKSAGGLYGDVIECIDWSVGRILDTVKGLGLDEHTVVIFTSDNGPWLVKGEDGGFAAPLRAGKGTTYEGGMRVPCIMRWPGRIPAGSVCAEVASTIDLLPTLTKLAGGGPPEDRIIDGKDLWPLMSGEAGAVSPHEAFYYYFGQELHAVRSGPWKLKFETSLRGEDIYRAAYQRDDVKIPPALYNLRTDPGEQKNLYNAHPDVVERLSALADRAREDLGDSRTGAVGKGLRAMGTA
ncbi:MAG: sulfatase [Candidatus Hydrogenedentes bacterium]|nr:sulfatase [Candidatus Hydrogenedentota bacterium]